MTATWFSKVLGAAALATALILGAGGPAAAQSGSGGETTAPKTDWSQAKLESFAAAAVAVGQTTTKWRQRISEAESDQKARQLQEQAKAEMAQVIRDEGLTVEEYRRIYTATQNDEQLRQKVMALVEQEQTN